MADKGYEILAPVGNYEALCAAVRSGADAVYFGMKDFSARRNAENFSEEEMVSGIKYCKRRGVKTYLTLNIAIKQNELASAFEVAKKAYFSGIDGFIVSDLGIAKMIRETMPDVQLHASTQMTVNSPSALPILKELGFCRVVPAREMSKAELNLFCKKAKEAGIEVEAFVHGALCMCLSGQCLMSSVLGGRSGNRGLCAGPCRLPFMVPGGTGYDLSLKDLSLVKYINEMINMGIYSFKIEGRMKRPEYIAAAVTACRNAAENGFLSDEATEILENVFSRSGFTDGYYTGKLGKEMFGVRKNSDIQKSKQIYNSIHNLYRNEFPRIPLSVTAEIRENSPIKISFFYCDKTVCESGGIPIAATKKATREEDVIKLISKLGGTPFFIEKIDITIDDGLFVSAGEINEIRRKCCERLEGLLEKTPDRRFFEKSFKNDLKKIFKQKKIYAEFLNPNQIPDCAADLDLIILPLEKFAVNKDFKAEYAVKLPKFTDSEENLIKELEKLKKIGVKKAVCGTLPALAVALKCKMEVMGDIGLNVLNTISAEVLKDLGVKEITVSAEADIKTVKDIKTDIKTGIFAYGRLPLMCMKNCPLKNGKGCKDCKKTGVITDRLNTSFPVICRAGYSELYNSKPIYTADRQDEFPATDYMVLSFTTETRDECEKIIKCYNNGDEPIDEYTRGLYFRELF